MATREGAVHVVTTRRGYKDKVYETHLLRRSYREDGKVKNETVGNLSHLPAHVIELVRRALKGDAFTSVADTFEITSSVAHGDAKAVAIAMRKLGFRDLLSSRPCREADLVTAMVIARIIAPHTKLATTRWWHTSTLAEDLGVADASEDDLYRAMDWLLERQPAIEKKLAARHLDDNSLVLYDLSSSYFEGTCCPLAKLGHNRDRTGHKLQVNYGLLTTSRGCPVAVSVYDGNTNDAKTLLPQVRKLRDDFGIKTLVIAGDRGMVSQKAIDELKDLDGAHWITALKSGQLRALLDEGRLQLGLFDERNLFELSHPDFPGERLIACRNPELAKLRSRKRESLLEATTTELTKVLGMVERGRLRGAAAIGVRVGKVVNKYKVAKHFALDIQDDRFTFHIVTEHVAAEAALDGIYVIRTDLPKKQLSAADTVRSYKMLSNVERGFRTIKTVDLKVRPIHHRLEDRVRCHIFLCILAYYVEWHMREAWRPVLFSDEDQDAKLQRDPVAPAPRSAGAENKAVTHTLPDGTQAHSFRTLLQELASIVRNTCRAPGANDDARTFTVTTTPTRTQQRAFELLESLTL
ncbi:MAG TPA: IS1634 family transposase [Kofleriaceae bacterium]